VRVPLYHPGKENATRMELRAPDPACNPYLTFAVLLQAGLEGIERGYELPEPMEKNLYHLSPDERRRQTLLRSSVLDFAMESTQSLKKELGPTDRNKLDEYFTGKWRSFWGSHSSASIPLLARRRTDTRCCSPH